ncbi:RDD family protein [Micromonospora zhanjiangensis]
MSLDLRVARTGSRMLARLIDLVVQVATFWMLITGVGILAVLVGQTGLVELDSAWFDGIVVVVIATVVLGYPVLLESVSGGRTLGKYALGLRVVRDDGGPIRFRQAMTRGLVSAAIEWPGLLAPPLTWLACLWTMTVSPQGKRLGDYAAGTIVVHERTPAVWGWMPPTAPGLAGWASTLDLAGMDDDLALAVRHFLSRQRQLREPARGRLAYRLAAEVAAATRPPPPAGTPHLAYLAAVHAERHRRALRRLAAVRARAAAVWPELVVAPPPPGPWSSPRPPMPGQAYPGAGQPWPAVRSAVPGAADRPRIP